MKKINYNNNLLNLPWDAAKAIFTAVFQYPFFSQAFLTSQIFCPILPNLINLQMLSIPS